MKTEFYKLAEKIGNDMGNSHYFMCNELHGEYRNFTIRYFKPTWDERSEYEHSMMSAWAYEIGSTYNSNQFRILALLFADLMWRDEVKNKRK